MELCQTSDHIYIYKGLRGSGGFGPHPPGLRPQNSHFESQNAPDSQTKSIHGQCLRLRQTVGHIYIYIRGLGCLGPSDPTLRGPGPKHSFCPRIRSRSTNRINTLPHGWNYARPVTTSIYMLQVSAVPLPSPRKGDSTPRPPCGWGWGVKPTVSIQKSLRINSFQQQIQPAAAAHSRSSKQQPAARSRSPQQQHPAAPTTGV